MGRFGAFTRDTNRATVLATLEPSDHWVTYTGIYGYGCVFFEIVDDVPDPQFRLSVGFAVQHAEHFNLPYESWRENAEHSWKKMPTIGRTRGLR